MGYTKQRHTLEGRWAGHVQSPNLTSETLLDFDQHNQVSVFKMLWFNNSLSFCQQCLCDERQKKKKTGKGWCSTVAVPLLKINVFLVLVLEVSLVYLLIEPHKVVHIFRLCLIMCHQSYKELKRAWKVVDLHPNRCSLAASIFLTAELVCRNPENLSGGEPKFRSFPEEFS